MISTGFRPSQRAERSTEQPNSRLIFESQIFLSRGDSLPRASLLLHMDESLTGMIHQGTLSLFSLAASASSSFYHPVSPLFWSSLLTHPTWIFFFFLTPQADPSRHGADLGLQLRGRQRGGQGAAVLLRGHRLPGPPALSPPCSQQIPLLQRPGAHFPSVRVKFLLKRFSVLPFTWKNHRWTRSRNGLWLCLGGGDSQPLGLLPPSRGSLKEGAFPALFQLSTKCKAQTSFFFQQQTLPQYSQEVLPSQLGLRP